MTQRHLVGLTRCRLFARSCVGRYRVQATLTKLIYLCTFSDLFSCSSRVFLRGSNGSGGTEPRRKKHGKGAFGGSSGVFDCANKSTGFYHIVCLPQRGQFKMHASLSVESKTTIGKSTVKTRYVFDGNSERTHGTHPNEFEKPTTSRRIKFILNAFHNARPEIAFEQTLCFTV